MDISVVIPVYNAAPWIDECLTSVVYLPQVQEIIVIDDGSSDHSHTILLRWAAQHPKIIIATHPDRKNHGRSATRNLGIKMATCEWVAFLDADDVYASERFSNLPNNPKADGYYGVIGQIDSASQTGISTHISPESLLDYLVSQSSHHFSILSLTVRRECLIQIGGFDIELEASEDTDLIWRLAHRYRLESMQADGPVAYRRVHSSNTYSEADALSRYRYAFYKKWYLQNGIPLSYEARRRIKNAYTHYHPINQSMPRFIQPLTQRIIGLVV